MTTFNDPTINVTNDDYKPGDECLIIDHKATGKLDARFIGPFAIIQAHTNGTITIQKTQHITD